MLLLIFALVITNSANCEKGCSDILRNVTTSVSYDGVNFFQYNPQNFDCINHPLNVLRVDGCIHHLTSKSIADLPHLTMLLMENIGLLKLSPKFIHNVPRLKTVSITYNPLSNIEEEVFADFEIQYLKISSNMIKTLEDNCFRNVRLVSLDLSNNHIAYLNSKAFRSIFIPIRFTLFFEASFSKKFLLYIDIQHFRKVCNGVP